MYLTDKTLTNLIQTNLNTIAENLYDDETIDNKIVFYVTNNVATFDDKIEMEFKVNDNIRYTPILMNRVMSNMIDDNVQGLYQEGYTLEILAYEKDKEDIEKIFNQYTYEENLNDSKIVGTWTILKTNTSRLQFNQTYDNPNENVEAEYKKFISYLLNFTWQFVLGGVKDESSSFTINGNAIDVIGVAYSSDKTTISNVAYGENTTPIGATGFTLSLTIPAQTNDTNNKALFADLTSKKYNKSYTIVWTIDGFHTQSYIMTMRSGNLNYVRDQLISYTVTFEEALPRTSITVNGEVLPIITFGLQRTVKSEPNASGVESKYAVTETGYTLNMKIGYDPTNAANVALLKSVVDSNYYNTTYEVVMIIEGGITKTYNCVLVGGIYAFEQSGELMYDVALQEVNDAGI